MKRSTLEQLENLRKLLLKCTVFTLLLMIPAYFAAPELIGILLKIILPEELGTLNSFSVMEVFTIQLKFAFFLALAVALPFNFIRIWHFAAPGLFQKERRSIPVYAAVAALLFILGASVNLALIFPLTLRFSCSITPENVHPVLGFANVMELLLWMTFICGLFFQIPLIIFIINKYGIISCEKINQLRPYLLTAILIAAAIFSPPDPLSMLLLALPAWLLVEAAIITAKCTARRRQENPAADSA